MEVVVINKGMGHDETEQGQSSLKQIVRLNHRSNESDSLVISKVIRVKYKSTSG